MARTTFTPGLASCSSAATPRSRSRSRPCCSCAATRSPEACNASCKRACACNLAHERGGARATRRWFFVTWRTSGYAPLVEIEPDVNVVGGELLPCSTEPLTGFYRNGCCSTGPDDLGSHTVCVVVTAEFLAFSKSAGN